MNAPYYGGYAPGNRIFAVDGNFTVAMPVTPPAVSYPFRGDSCPDITSIVLLDSTGTYVTLPIGAGYNIQPFAANQSAIVFEQEFMVALSAYLPLPLNTPYNTAWSIGWYPVYADLAACFLVEEGPLEHVGAGIVRFKRKFANLPTTRNVPESYGYTIPAWTDGTNTRISSSRILASRVQLDYYVYDDLGLLNGLIPGLFPAAHRLNAATGMFPQGLILPEMRYFKPGAGSVANNLLLDPDEPLQDDTSPPTGSATNPTYSQYISWVANKYEIVAEASSLELWMGNIYQRKTRFVQVQ
jgi:hypothetical protein